MKFVNTHWGRYTYDIHEYCLIFKTPSPLFIYDQNISTPLTLDVQFLNGPSRLHPLQQTM